MAAVTELVLKDGAQKAAEVEQREEVFVVKESKRVKPMKG